LCANRSTVIGYNDILTLYPEKAKLFLNNQDSKKYTIHSGQRTDFRCPICGTIIRNKQIQSVMRYGLHCSKCSDNVSYPNKLMFNILLQIGINFETEKVFTWCKFFFHGEIRYGRYDFYFILNNQPYIVEMDGGWHKEDNILNGQTKEDSQFIDNEKDRLAIENGIIVIRIDCEPSEFGYIKNNILKSTLYYYLNLSKIDWDYINLMSLKSRIVESCDLFNKKISISKIAKNYKTSTITIRAYLKRGIKIGLCNYISHITSDDGRFKKGNGAKSIICLTNNTIFNSIKDGAITMNTYISPIIKTCKGLGKYAGKLTDGTPLRWMYLDDYMKQNGYTDISQIPNVTIHTKPETVNLKIAEI
jgi:predicted RNA-binding Zn-ribbon protein involved in translation (DUF1610 family)